MKELLKKMIDVAMGRIPADVVIKNCKVVNVYSGEITDGDIAISGGQIAGVGTYEGKEMIDAEAARFITDVDWLVMHLADDLKGYRGYGK